MGQFNIRHLREKNGKYYWEPSASLKNIGLQAIPLGKSRSKAIRIAEYWNTEADKAREAAADPYTAHGTISWVINRYCKSSRFTKLRASSQKGYLQNLSIIKKFAGDKQPLKLRPKLVERWYDRLRDDTPASANAVMRVLSIIMEYAMLEELIDKNPVKDIKIVSVPPRQEIWEPEDIENFTKTALLRGYKSMALALRLGADTGQRQGDILSLSRNQYDGSHIRFKQSKTSQKVQVAVTPELKRMLTTTGGDHLQVLVSEDTNAPYKGDHFRHLFSALRKEAGVDPKLQFRDLRRTAVVRLALAGATIAEIVAITGHTLASATHILEVYLPRHTKMADHGIAKLISFESNNIT